MAEFSGVFGLINLTAIYGLDDNASLFLVPVSLLA